MLSLLSLHPALRGDGRSSREVSILVLLYSLCSVMQRVCTVFDFSRPSVQCVLYISLLCM